MARKRTLPSPRKARQILREGRARGKKLTPKQKRTFGKVISGTPFTRLKRNG